VTVGHHPRNLREFTSHEEFGVASYLYLGPDFPSIKVSIGNHGSRHDSREFRSFEDRAMHPAESVSSPTTSLDPTAQDKGSAGLWIVRDTDQPT